MKITIITGSQRKNSNSKFVGLNLKEKLEQNFSDVSVESVCLYDAQIPYWDEDKYSDKEKWAAWSKVSEKLAESDAFIFVVPEYNGMVPPMMTNFFLNADQGELSHKPALLVSVSAGINGVYPISELRAYSFKNNKVCFIPEHLIIRNVNDILNKEVTSKEKDYINERIDYTLPVLVEYAKALKPVRESQAVKTDKFGFGM
tara:strand:+ start:676 stop:1278 length:603 start_codon:yes stop_codon:yes gene_type:complete